MSDSGRGCVCVGEEGAGISGQECICAVIVNEKLVS